MDLRNGINAIASIYLDIIHKCIYTLIHADGSIHVDTCNTCMHIYKIWAYCEDGVAAMMMMAMMTMTIHIKALVLMLSDTHVTLDTSISTSTFNVLPHTCEVIPGDSHIHQFSIHSLGAPDVSNILQF